jgi:putative peptidoglycan lipid II flippase
LGLSNFVTGLLHSFKKFGPAAATGVVFNLAVVLVTIPLAQRIGIFAPAIGVLIGCILQLGIMLPSLFGTGLFPSVGFTFRDPALVRMWRLFLPIFMGGLIVTALKTVDKIVGSFLPAGSISALNYAAKIAGGPSRIFAMSIAVVLFPTFARKVAEGVEGKGEMIIRGLNLAAFLTLPFTALLIALREPVVFVLLQRGAFDAAATSKVALALAIYCLGDFADAISTMVNNAFYSHHDSRIPTLVYVGSSALRAVVIVALVPFFGYLAIAVGNAIAVDIALVLLLLLLRKHVPLLDLRGLGVGFFKIVVAAVGSGVAGWAAYSFIHARIGDSQLQTTAALLISVVPALAVYLVLARVFRCDEAAELERRIGDMARRFRGRAA